MRVSEVETRYGQTRLVLEKIVSAIKAQQLAY